MLGRLADLTGKDSQSKIDEVIKIHEKGVSEPISPKTGKPETIYTKLRNDHMHRSGVPIAQVRAEMEKHLHGLVMVVQMAIMSS